MTTVAAFITNGISTQDIKKATTTTSTTSTASTTLTSTSTSASTSASASTSTSISMASTVTTTAQLDKQRQLDLQSAICIIENRLYFMATRYRFKNTENISFINIDKILIYEPFFMDFGPLNLGCLYKFCTLLKHKLKEIKANNNNNRIYYYCDKDPKAIANACYLIGSFQILELSKHPTFVVNKLKSIAQYSMPFRDASMGICTYRCTIEHCLWAVFRAHENHFLDFRKFNVNEYEHYEKVECGDLNVIIPNKFIAFAGPHYKQVDDEGYPALTADFYIPIFSHFGVTTIIRLNKKCYDRRIYVNAGFDHHDLYFVDGTTPSDTIIKRFLEICENAKGMIAVHCKAGLGRTGSCIGCYMMKHFCYTAAEVIAWLRICRPGSVIGPQQQFLEEQQSIMWKAGDEYRKKNGITLKYDPRLENKKNVEENVTNCIIGTSNIIKKNENIDNDNNNSNNNNKGNSSSSTVFKHKNNEHISTQVDDEQKYIKNDDNDDNKSDIHNLSPSCNRLDRDNLTRQYPLQQHNNHRHQHLNSTLPPPLPTDPGQNQGQALLDAKRKHLSYHNSDSNHNNHIYLQAQPQPQTQIRPSSHLLPQPQKPIHLISQTSMHSSQSTHNDNKENENHIISIKNKSKNETIHQNVNNHKHHPAVEEISQHNNNGHITYNQSQSQSQSITTISSMSTSTHTTATNALTNPTFKADKKQNQYRQHNNNNHVYN